MTQNEIMDALRKSLDHGTGSLDDLSKLLTRVQSDIEDAKKQEADAKAKAETERGNRIAFIATNMLQRKLTDDDMAFIFNEYFGGAHWTAKDIKELGEASTKGQEIAVDLEKAMNELAETLSDLFGAKPVKVEAKCKCDNTKPKDADDVIKKFLKDFGLN